jgi:2-keto-4-pentenoate hydratase
VPGDLGELIAFAADFLAAFGEGLLEGDLLLSGAYLSRALALAPGARAVAEFGPAGVVSVQIGDPEA